MYTVARRWIFGNEELTVQVTADGLIQRLSEFTEVYGSVGFRSIVSYHRIDIYSAQTDAFITSISWERE